jgi:hypothetical protein
MGRKTMILTAYGHLAAHNDDQDAKDLEAWAEFVTVVKEAAQRAQFADLTIDVVAASD